jgi:hypothetical protein
MSSDPRSLAHAHALDERREVRLEQIFGIGEVRPPGGSVCSDVIEPHEVGLVSVSRAANVLEERDIEDLGDLLFIEIDRAGEGRADEA